MTSMNATSSGDAYRQCAPPIQIRLSADTETTLKKATAASAGALMTSLFVTPLDVAKVRLQAQVMKSTSGSFSVAANALPATSSTSSSSSLISTAHHHHFATRSPAANVVSRCNCSKRLWMPPGQEPPRRTTCFSRFARCFSLRARAHRSRCPGRALLPRATATALAPAVTSMTSSPMPTVPVPLPAVSSMPSPVVVLRTHTNPPVRLRGMTHALRHIFKTEGVAGLYSGLSPAMMIAIPSTVLYYVSYDKLLSEGRAHFSQFSPIIPLVSGSIARIVAATVTSPIELVRTRMQSDPNSLGVLRMMVVTLRQGGAKALFRGLNATLARDVPFSAIYWSCYESLQQRIQQQQSVELTRIQRAFLCGALSGSVAATFTTPFDVVKTLQQVNSSMQHRSTSEVLQRIVATRGFRGCFVGLTARLSRVAPSCAIMIATYELGKEKLGL